MRRLSVCILALSVFLAVAAVTAARTESVEDLSQKHFEVSVANVDPQEAGRKYAECACRQRLAREAEALPEAGNIERKNADARADKAERDLREISLIMNHRGLSRDPRFLAAAKAFQCEKEP